MQSRKPPLPSWVPKPNSDVGRRFFDVPYETHESFWGTWEWPAGQHSTGPLKKRSFDPEPQPGSQSAAKFLGIGEMRNLLYNHVSPAPQFTGYMCTASLTSFFIACLFILVVYIIALCSSINTTTFCRFYVCSVLTPTNHIAEQTGSGHDREYAGFLKS